MAEQAPPATQAINQAPPTRQRNHLTKSPANRKRQAPSTQQLDIKQTLKYRIARTRSDQ